ncbi:MAG: tetratricopeptide repeat protein [Trueperaceae bacterium]
MSDEAVFGHWLQQRRKSMKLTQEQLAGLAACSVATIRKVEADERRPSIGIAGRLAEALEVPAGERDAFLRFARGGWSDDPAVTPQDPPTPLPWDGPVHRASPLPLPLTQLLGREPVLQSTVGLLRRRGVRLVTLTGPGGIGKTHLALEVAQRVQMDFPDGARWAMLASLEDAERLPSALAQIFGVQESGSYPLWDRIKDHLQDKSLLLVLDNFEQIIAAAPLVSDLLRACAGVKVLVTSREVLRLSGEHEVAVPPLDAPPIGSHSRFDPDEAASYAAVELFMQRAQAVRPEFTLTPENAAAVAEVCSRLDGLPLAIELAAARIRLFSPEAMLSRLTRSLDLLTGGSRDAPGRQRTMRQAIAWSYELLDEEERRMLRRFSVLSGGFTLEAADAVGLPERDLLNTVTSLIEKSLLKSDAGEEPRFVMLETIRGYGVEMLGEHGEEAEVRYLHATYFADFMTKIEPDLHGPEQAKWMRLAGREHANIGVALRWCLDSGDSSTALRLASATWWYWFVRGHLTEGRETLAELLPMARASDSPLLSDVLLAAAELAVGQNDHAQGAVLFREAESASRSSGGSVVLARALRGLSCVSVLTGDFRTATGYVEEGLAEARGCSQEREVALFLNSLGEIARSRGEYDKAEAHYEESIAILRGLGDWVRIVTVLANLGYMAQRQGDLSRSIERFSEGLRLAQEVGSIRGIGTTLAGLAGVAVVAGNPRKAAMLFGAAEAVHGAHGVVPEPVDRAEMERSVALGRAAVTPETWTSCTAEGTRMSVEEAIAAALEVEPTNIGLAATQEAGR